MSVRSDRRGKAEGSIAYSDTAVRLAVRSTRITRITVAGHTATVTGSGLAGKRPVTFVVVAGEASPGTFAIRLSTGYSAADSLKKGKIRVGDRCEHGKRRH